MNPSAPERTWIVLADASRARIHLADKELTHTTLIRELDHPESRVKDSDLVTDSQGRTQPRQRNNPSQPNVEPRTYPKAVEMQTFARQLAGELEHGRVQGAFDELIIAAPPQFLGLLRDAMDRNLLATVRVDIPKRLTDLRHDELIPRIQALLLDAGRG